MRFVDVFVGVVFLGVVSLVLGNGISICKNLDKKYLTILQNKNQQKFIAESFKKTCLGQCFFDLNEWQINCKEMFNLEYIAWSNANEFMEVSMNTSNEDLFYGVWKIDGQIKEVYCRKKRF